MSEAVLDDPFGAPEIDDDPFATSDDVKPGSFTPRPLLEDLEGRLIVMVPRSLDKESKVPERFAKTPGEVREQYTIDLVLLGGGDLTYEYKSKEDGAVVVKTHTVRDPFTWEGLWIPQASIIGQLKKVDGTRRPLLLGVLTRGPQADDKRDGKTVADIAAEFAAWRQKPKGNPPKFSWFVDVDAVDEIGTAAARSWYASAVAGGFKI